jgi:hypothetical protein
MSVYSTLAPVVLEPASQAICVLREALHTA